MSEDNLLMARCFEDAFSSVYSGVAPINPSAHQTSWGLLSEVKFEVHEVDLLLSKLDRGSSMGMDQLSPWLLRECSGALVCPLALVFNKSFRQRRLPRSWKSSLVVPIFKSGQRSDPLNYRPVSLTSVVCKVMEKVIVRRLYEYLEENLILNDNQFGFRQGRSTSEQLLLTYSEVSKWYYC